jgi:hypothetical protein
MIYLSFLKMFVCAYMSSHIFLVRRFQHLIRYLKESMTLPKMLETIFSWDAQVNIRNSIRYIYNKASCITFPSTHILPFCLLK